MCSRKLWCIWLSKWRTNSRGGAVMHDKTPYLGFTWIPNVVKKEKKLVSTKSKTENTQETTIHGS